MYSMQTNKYQAELKLTAAVKMGRILPVFVLAAGGINTMIYSVLMLNFDAIHYLDDKSELPLFVLVAGTEEDAGGKNILLIVFSIKLIFLLHHFYRHIV